MMKHLTLFGVINMFYILNVEMLMMIRVIKTYTVPLKLVNFIVLIKLILKIHHNFFRVFKKFRSLNKNVAYKIKVLLIYITVSKDS